MTNETENPDLELINGERNAAASLVVMELLTSQAGEYSCNARVSPLSSDTVIGLSEEFHLVVRSEFEYMLDHKSHLLSVTL